MAISKSTRSRIEELLRCEEHNDIFNLTTEERRAFQYEVLNALEDADPVKHGKWINGGYACGETEWVCSECGFTEWRTSNSSMVYCMHCGARMDRVEDDDHDYERAIDELEHNILHEPTFNIDDGSM